MAGLESRKGTMSRILETLTRLWEYDIAVFSSLRLYALLCVPAVIYLSFFFIKWTAITTPLWLPITIIIKAFAAISWRKTQ